VRKKSNHETLKMKINSMRIEKERKIKRKKRV
jgi:hypothetical protein